MGEDWVVEPATSGGVDRAASAAVRANLGPFQSETDALAALVDRLVSTLDPQAIWLFGSRAAGTALPESDFDLLVVAQPAGQFGNDDHELVDRAIRSLRIGCDVVPCAFDDFAVGLGLKTSFVSQIVRTGTKLYERGGASQ